MRPIPAKLSAQLQYDPFMRICCRKDGGCSGRVTWEHCWIFAGKQINERWAIVPLCEFHHLGKGLDKDYGRWVSLGRATEAELTKYPRYPWKTHKNYLDAKYGAN